MRYSLYQALGVVYLVFFLDGEAVAVFPFMELVPGQAVEIIELFNSGLDPRDSEFFGHFLPVSFPVSYYRDISSLSPVLIAEGDDCGLYTIYHGALDSAGRAALCID